LYEELPEYKDRDLYVTGESFAGKYLSYSAKSILDHNDLGGDQINMKALILSNPLVDEVTERIHQHELGFSLGLYDDS